MRNKKGNVTKKTLNDHFEFGQNWKNYAVLIDSERIHEAKKNLIELLGHDNIRGKTILDIGCGSGIHSLAFLELGAANVTAFDFDPTSVSTTRNLLKEYSNHNKFNVYQGDILAPTLTNTQYDVVYSWGVLHHTGNLELALFNAANYVRQGGYLFIAIYKNTKLCWLWKKEKRFYSSTSRINQQIIKSFYITIFAIGYTIFKRKSFRKYILQYQKNRGMSFFHDVHDWLGGYPYESATPQRINTSLMNMKFELVKEVITKAGIGFFGSSCNEYVFKKDDKSYGNFESR